ncbi:MAG TPA: hypothetical protein VMY41_16285 [Thermohalobaculum sp.]|nr:hypothetical protein [Thermohalobaculum sp.]
MKTMIFISSTDRQYVGIQGNNPHTGQNFVLCLYADMATGYVYKSSGGQVCANLQRRGPTLKLAKGNRLIDLIRSELARSRRAYGRGASLNELCIMAHQQRSL